MNKLRRAILLAMVLVLIAIATSPWQAQPSVSHAQDFDRRAMLTNITNEVILPYHEAFVDSTIVLQDALVVFQEDPTPETLSAAQLAWQDASTAWEHCEVFQFGRMLLYHTPIERLPANIDGIEDNILKAEHINNLYIEERGSNSKGLPAIEYLIFNVDGDNDAILTALTSSENRMSYLVALGENLHQKAQELYDLWSPDHGNYAETFINADGEGENLRESFAMLTNRMVAELEFIQERKIGKPAGYFYGDGVPRPAIAEAPFSQHSLPQIIANIESLQMTFTGGDGLGFDDYLDFLGAEAEEGSLAEAMATQFEITLASLQAIDEPLVTALINQPDLVKTAYDEVHILLLYIRIDMAAQFGITITFTDTDGD